MNDNSVQGFQLRSPNVAYWQEQENWSNWPKKSRPALPKSNIWQFGHYSMKVHTLTTQKSEKQTYLSEKVPCYEAMKFCCFLATRAPNGLISCSNVTPFD